jgi:hypothetical protein
MHWAAGDARNGPKQWFVNRTARATPFLKTPRTPGLLSSQEMLSRENLAQPQKRHRPKVPCAGETFKNLDAVWRVLARAVQYMRVIEECGVHPHSCPPHPGVGYRPHSWQQLTVQQHSWRDIVGFCQAGYIASQTLDENRTNP